MRKVLLFLLLIIALPVLSQTFTRDNLGRITRIAYSNSITVKYTYDKNGNRVAEEITANTPLPVELLQFNATKQNPTVLLSWVTSQETNSSKFEVEFSSNGVIFQVFTTVIAKGNSTTSSNYSTIHCCPVGGANFYRLKMIDIDGKFKYSQIRKVIFDDKTEMKVFPNPVSENNLTISFSKPLSDDAQLYLYSVAGLMIYNGSLQKGKKIYELNTIKIPAGSYLIVVNTQEQLYQAKIVKQ